MLMLIIVKFPLLHFSPSKNDRMNNKGRAPRARVIYKVTVKVRLVAWLKNQEDFFLFIVAVRNEKHC